MSGLSSGIISIADATAPPPQNNFLQSNQPDNYLETLQKIKRQNISNFIMNSLDNGWKVHKDRNLYIFTKKHENKREVFMDSYLEIFIHDNNI